MRFCPSVCFPILVLVTFAAVHVTQPSRARACSCLVESVQDARRTADAVLEAHVTQVLPERGEWLVRAKVVRRFQGTSQEHVEILTAHDSAGCGYSFAVGQSYLVYAKREGTRLRVSLCSRTQPIAQAEQDLRELGLGVTPFEPGQEGDAKVPPSSVSPPRRAGCASCAVGARAGAEDGARAGAEGLLAAAAGLLLALAITCRRRSRSRS